MRAGRAAAGVPGRGAAAGQRADRAAQEHLGRRRVRPARGVRPDAVLQQRQRRRPGR